MDAAKREEDAGSGEQHKGSSLYMGESIHAMLGQSKGMALGVETTAAGRGAATII